VNLFVFDLKGAEALAALGLTEWLSLTDGNSFESDRMTVLDWR
jgi:hypothetical protein